MELKPGTVLAGHRIEGIVGRGGMGVVYRRSSSTSCIQVTRAAKVSKVSFAARIRVGE